MELGEPAAIEGVARLSERRDFGCPGLDWSAQRALMKRMSRDAITTPALVLDLDAFETNLATMAARCRSAGIALRPHVKTHKSSEIARRQIELGAVGLCCATVQEAEVMAGAGLPGILITSPVVTVDKMAAVIAMCGRAPDLMVLSDNLENVAAWNSLARGAECTLAVLVDLDVGHHRSGATSVKDAVRLAEAIAASDRLEFGGLQAYAGHLQHIEKYADRFRRAAECAAEIRRVLGALAAAGLPPRIVSGGGTGTHAIEPELDALTELQAGSYVFMDAEYARVAMNASGSTAFRPSLYVQSTVISTNLPGFVQTDAGTKAFAVNGPAPEISRGCPAGSTYSYLGDEHGRVTLPVGGIPPRIGERIECLTPHCDPTVNLYDRYMCMRGEKLISTWAIDARRRSV